MDARTCRQSFSQITSAPASASENVQAPVVRPVSGVSAHGQTPAVDTGAIRSAAPTPPIVAACTPTATRNHRSNGARRGRSLPGARACTTRAARNPGGTTSESC